MLNWNNIDTVLLDMDGTLLDLYFDNHFWLEHLPKRYAEIHQQDLERSKAYLFERIQRERGTLNWYCLDYWSEQLQVDITGLKREIAHLISMRPHVEEFLRRLQQGPQQVWLVTNAHPDSMYLKFEHTNLETLIDKAISTHSFQLPKEQPAFWQRLQQQEPFDPQRSLLIDDTESILHTAKAFGIGHLLTTLQPDSRQAKRLETEFPGIHHFDEIMPTANE